MQQDQPFIHLLVFRDRSHTVDKIIYLCLIRIYTIEVNNHTYFYFVTLLLPSIKKEYPTNIFRKDYLITNWVSRLSLLSHLIRP